eukprot:tig00021127_g18796.t1
MSKRAWSCEEAATGACIGRFWRKPRVARPCTGAFDAFSRFDLQDADADGDPFAVAADAQAEVPVAGPAPAPSDDAEDEVAGLPDEILMHVFAFFQAAPVPDLFRMRRVCRRWRILLTGEPAAHLYAQLDFVACHRLSVESAVAAIRLAGPQLQLLALPPSGRRAWAEALAALAESCPNVRALRVENMEAAGDASVGAVARACRALRELNAASPLTDAAELSLRRARVTDEGALAVAKACRALRSLSLRQCEGLTAAGAERLAARLAPSLTALDLSGVPLSPAAIAALAACPALRSLSLFRCPGATGAAVAAAATAWPCLESLELGGLASLDDAALAAVAAGCPRLRALDLRACPLLSDPALAALPAALPALRALDLGGTAASEGAKAALRARGVFVEAVRYTV